MLEFANDRILGVDTPGQYVPPRIRYGMTCLLIMDVMGSVSCSNEFSRAQLQFVDFSTTHL
jgi:hypothetical protein